MEVKIKSPFTSIAVSACSKDVFSQVMSRPHIFRTLQACGHIGYPDWNSSNHVHIYRPIGKFFRSVLKEFLEFADRKVFQESILHRLNSWNRSSNSPLTCTYPAPWSMRSLNGTIYGREIQLFCCVTNSRIVVNENATVTWSILGINSYNAIFSNSLVLFACQLSFV